MLIFSKGSSKKDSVIIGWYSFMTDQKRKTSIVSKDFATVYEIKKTDFQRILLSNPSDYVTKHFIINF